MLSRLIAFAFLTVSGAAFAQDAPAKTDPNRSALDRELKAFARKAAGAHTTLLFYSGHGMEVTDRGSAYDVLAPTDAEINCDQEEHYETYKLEEMVSSIRGAITICAA